MQAQVQESIYHPQDHSLASRIEALKIVLQEKRNIELSLELMANPEWSERLGSTEELQQAHSLISNSLEQAIHKISDKDLTLAKEQQLLDNTLLREIKFTKAQTSIKQQRQSHESFSHQHSKSDK